MITSGHELWLLTSQYSVNLSSEEVHWLIKEEVSSDEFLEPPILPLDKAIRPLTLCKHVTGKDHRAVATRAHTNIHTCTYICIYTCTHTHTRTHTHAHTHTHTHTHTHRHTTSPQEVATITYSNHTNTFYQCTVSFSHPLSCVLPSCRLGWRS